MFRRDNHTHDARIRGALGVLTAVAVLGAGISCAEDPEDIAKPVANDPQSSGLTPPIPMLETTAVGETTVDLEWLVDDDAGVASYIVYRTTQENDERRLADGITEMTYQDRNLRVGQPYLYRVSAVLTNGLEGERSESVIVTPATYSVLIDGGADYARRRRVTLTLVAPGTTESMRIGEMADLSDEPWTNFSPGYAFDLEPGPDGVRTVYAQYRTSGNVTSVVSDDITLDTVAEITRVTQDAGTTPVPPGSIVRFTVETGEPAGNATVDIGTESFGIRLFDDGSHGDGLADDGVYTVDYTLPINLEVRDADITGRFTDAASNTAEARIAEDPLTVSDGTADPDPVTATLVETSSVSVTWRWTESDEADFNRYELSKATAADPGVFSLYKTVTNRSLLSDTDFFPAVAESTYLFYRVTVVDNDERSAESNVVTAPVGEP
jgi:hypothetical protein